MDRKKQILNAIKNKKFYELVFLETDEDILAEITDELLEKNDFVPCVVIGNNLFLHASRSYLKTLGEEKVKRNRIIKPIKTKVEIKISDKLISLIKTNKVDLFNDFFQELYENEEEYKDILSSNDEYILQKLISYNISKDNFELLFEMFKYLNDSFSIDYDESIEAMFRCFLENKDKAFYSKFKKEIVIWFNEFVFDMTPIDVFENRNFLDLVIQYDTKLAASILTECLCINNLDLQNENILYDILKITSFLKKTRDLKKTSKKIKTLQLFVTETKNEHSFSLLLLFSIINDINNADIVLNQIISSKLDNKVFDLICEKYLNPRELSLDFHERKKFVDYLLTKELSNNSKLKILESFISNQTTLTLQKDIFNLSDYIRKLYHDMIEGINRNSVEKSIKNDLKSLLLIIIRLFDNNFDLDDWKTRKIISKHLFHVTLDYWSENDSIFYNNHFSNLDLSFHEFNKTGISVKDDYKDDKHSVYNHKIKKDYFTFLIFHKIFFKLNKISDNNNELKKYVDLIHKLSNSLFVYTRNVTFINSAVEKKVEITQARVEERNRIMANLSHTVKNMIGTIIDPLENMKSQNKLQPVAIDNAIRGANLVRGLVNAMNQSFKGSIEDFQYDIQNAEYNNSTSIKQMFIESLKYSISSMFDGKYFEKFMRNYFPTKSIFLEAKNKWNEISQSSDLDLIAAFMNEFMLKTVFNLDSAKDFVIGNDKGSSLKFLILIQEMIFNAVKYSSFVPQDQRFIKIEFSADKENVAIKVSNKFQSKTNVKSSGLGQEIINNFSKLLHTEPNIKTAKEIYSVEVKFRNLWEV